MLFIIHIMQKKEMSHSYSTETVHKLSKAVLAEISGIENNGDMDMP